MAGAVTSQCYSSHIRRTRCAVAAQKESLHDVALRSARSCVKDEGRSLGIGFQERVSNQSMLLRSKVAVVSNGYMLTQYVRIGVD